MCFREVSPLRTNGHRSHINVSVVAQLAEWTSKLSALSGIACSYIASDQPSSPLSAASCFPAQRTLPLNGRSVTSATARGLAPRDVCAQIAQQFFDHHLPGFAEHTRGKSLSQQIVKSATVRFCEICLCKQFAVGALFSDDCLLICRS